MNLKPCPFCGHSARVDSTNAQHGEIFCAQCSNCRASAAFGDTREDAVENWNMRDSQEKDIAALKMEVKRLEYIIHDNVQAARRLMLAGQAMQGFLSNAVYDLNANSDQHLAIVSTNAADALLVELDKKETPDADRTNS